MKTKSLLIIAVLIAALRVQSAPNEIIYQTGFEPPAFTADLPVRGQDDWSGGWFLPGASHPTSISTVNARSGAQCLRFSGADAQGSIVGNAFAFRPLFDLNDPNPPPTPLIVEIRADVRLDGPQTGTLGTPEQDLISANLFAVVRQSDRDPVGNFDMGGFFVSSAGKIWAYNWTTGVPRSNYRRSVTYAMGTYHTLMLRVNFVSRTLTYFVDGVQLDAAPFPAGVKSDQLIGGYLSLYGGTQTINTPELSYSRANYNAYFDNYSIESVPLTPNDVAIQFLATDYAREEGDEAVIEIIRRGYGDSAVSATFSTADGTAAPGKDYKPGSTRVNFAAGETMKTVTIQTHDDRFREADETVNLALSAPSPGVLLWRPSATLWLLDDERAGSADTDFHFNLNKIGVSNIFEVPSVALLPDADGGFLASVFGEDAARNYVGVLARFNEDGSADSKFEPYPLPYGTGPSQITVLDEGKRLLVNVGDRLVRLDSRGRPDSNFFSAIAAGDPAIDPTGYIVGVAVQPDEKIIIAGLFSTLNGVARKNIARLHPNGALDTSFDPGAGTDDYIADVALQRNGKILIAGYFQNVAGQPHPLLARLNSNGSLDSTFDTGAGFGDSLYGFPGLQTLAQQPDGKILAGGGFDSYQGVPHRQLVRLLPDGTLDPSFDTGSGFESSFLRGTPGFVGRVVLQPDGKLLVTGGFGYYNGLWATGIIRLKPDGTLDPTFRLGGADAIAAGVNGGAALVSLPAGDILVPLSDNISFLRDDPIKYRGLVRLNGDSNRDDRNDDDKHSR
jgi:uncharacterized delta-60 repeat protein